MPPSNIPARDQRAPIPWALLWSLAAGLCMLALGVILEGQNYEIGAFLLPLSSCIVGSSASLLVAHTFGHGQSHRLDSILDHHISRAAQLEAEIGLQKHLPSQFMDRSETERFARPWHVYRASRDDGERVWIHDVIDFTPNSLSGPMITTDETSDGNSRTIQRVLTGITSTYRFMIFADMVSGGHGSTIYCFPLAGLDVATTQSHAGHVLLRDWDGNQLLARALLSKAPIDSVETDGVNRRRVDPDQHKLLDQEWERLHARSGASVHYDL